MFPKPLFPESTFPNQIFPFNEEFILNKYSQILLYIQSILQASQIFGPTRAPIVVNEEPFPINAGPIAYVMPGGSTAIDGQHMGDGRYFYGFNGNCTIRVVDRSLKDYTGVDELRLTDLATGLLRTAHKVINLFDITFAERIRTPYIPSPLYVSRFFADQMYPREVFPKIETTYESLTQEPMILQSHSPIRVKSRGNEWAGIDLNFRFPYTVEFQNAELGNPASSTINHPIPTNLADLLLAVKRKITSQGFLNTFQAIISLENDPFPITGGPFAIIAPEWFNAFDPDKFGAGRDFATMEGMFTVSPVVRNSLDITGYSDSALSGQISNISLYATAQFLMESLSLSFLYDENGNFIAENPLDLVSIGRPRIYNRNPSYVTLPLTFRVRYQEDLT